MEKHKVCANCGANMMTYRHTLAPILVSGLKALKTKGGGPINIKDLELSRTEWDNFQKLRYFDLVQKANPQNKKGGEWTITKLGEDFLLGLVAVPKSVQTYRGEVVDKSKIVIFITEVKGRTKTRIDYIKDAEPIGEIE